LKASPAINATQKTLVLKSFGNKIVNGEEFTVDEAARQILSPYFVEPKSLEVEIERLERTVLEQGIGDTNLRGVMTQKIEKMLGIIKYKTTENITIHVPSEYVDTKVEIKPSEHGDGQDILIKDVHIKP